MEASSPSGASEELSSNSRYVALCTKYVQLNNQIKENGAAVAALRKELKTTEKGLLAMMHAAQPRLEEVVANGVKISRVNKLQIVENK